jgi:hypothetical protein
LEIRPAELPEEGRRIVTEAHDQCSKATGYAKLDYVNCLQRGIIKKGRLRWHQEEGALAACNSCVAEKTFCIKKAHIDLYFVRPLPEELRQRVEPTDLHYYVTR